MCIRDRHADTADVRHHQLRRCRAPQLRRSKLYPVLGYAHCTGCTAVSYTHLDVYKRQAVFEALNKVDNNILKLDTAEMCIRDRFNKTAHDCILIHIKKDMQNYSIILIVNYIK